MNEVEGNIVKDKRVKIVKKKENQRKTKEH